MTLVKWQSWHEAKRRKAFVIPNRERIVVIDRPVKKKTKKKAPRRAEIKKLFEPGRQAVAEREIKKNFAALDDMIEERYEFATKVVEAQSAHIQQAVDDLVAEMRAMAGPPVFYYKGTPVHVADTQVCESLQGKNFYWIAVRLLVACAKWDMRVGDFKPPKDVCGVCGKKVKNG